MKVYSPNVPNLNLIDLPGIIMVACTDRGQPRNIKDQITNLITQYISVPNSIILAVIAARPDIEADPAMELVKHIDPKGLRHSADPYLSNTLLASIGCDDDVGSYLYNFALEPNRKKKDPKILCSDNNPF